MTVHRNAASPSAKSIAASAEVSPAGESGRAAPLKFTASAYRSRLETERKERGRTQAYERRGVIPCKPLLQERDREHTEHRQGDDFLDIARSRRAYCETEDPYEPAGPDRSGAAASNRRFVNCLNL